MASSPLRLVSSGRGRFVRSNALKKLAGLGALLAILFGKKAAKLIGRHVLDAKTHVSEDDVRRMISAYADGLISLRELDDWLTTSTWDSEDAPTLARDAELLIAEADRGDRADLADDLRELASRTAQPIS